MTANCPKFKTIDIGGLGVGFNEIIGGFLTVRVRSLFPETVLPCDIFGLAQRSGHRSIGLSKLVGKDRIYGQGFHRYLLDQDVDEVYIRGDDEQVFNEYFARNAQATLENKNTLPEKKAELIYDQAEFIVKRVFRERPTGMNISIGRQLVEQFSAHVLTDQVTSQALFSLFSKDYHTFSHCVQVAIHGMSLCRFLEWKTKDVEAFGLGALFHDIGKSAVDEQILNKTGKLTDEEFEIIKKHPFLGYQQIRTTQVMNKDQLSVVLQHHEAMDGSGYPQRLKGFEIHKYARVARIVDIYDALTTRRPYRDALPAHEALRIMNDEMRHTLDIGLFKGFIKLLQMQKHMPETSSDLQLDTKVGTPMQFRFEEKGIPLEAVLVGLEVNRALILRIPASEQIREHLDSACSVTCSYTRSNDLYTFRSDILKYVWQPIPLLLIAYPPKVNKCYPGEV